jgi:hypothetical protein
VADFHRDLPPNTDHFSNSDVKCLSTKLERVRFEGLLSIALHVTVTRTNRWCALLITLKGQAITDKRRQETHPRCELASISYACRIALCLNRGHDNYKPPGLCHPRLVPKQALLSPTWRSVLGQNPITSERAGSSHVVLDFMRRVQGQTSSGESVVGLRSVVFWWALAR